MHPVLSDPRRRHLFLVLWPLVGAGAGVLPFWWAGGHLRDAWAVALWGETLAAPVLASAYVCRSAPLASSSPWRVLTTIGLAASVSIGLWLEAGRLWLFLLSDVAATALVAFPAMAMPAALTGALVFMLACAVHYLLASADERQAASERALQAEVIARQAELRALRAQVDPHFLFNCLHSISALIGSNPAGARQMCIQLAEFFRESVRAGAQARIPLDAEVDLTRRYLAIEQLRFGPRLGIAIHIQPGIGSAMVPALLLQPLVENAVRHGIATLVGGGMVALDVTLDATRVAVRISNPYDPEEDTAGTGIGVRNVRARLAATFGSSATLRTEAADGQFVVQLTFPYEAQG